MTVGIARDADGYEPAARIRRSSSLILAAYVIPLALGGIFAATRGWRDGTGDLNPTAVLIGMVGFGLLLSLWQAVRSWVSAWGLPKARRLTSRQRERVLLEFPELDGVRMLSGPSMDIRVNHRELRIGARWLEQIRGTDGAMSDEAFQALAHEARHIEVGVSKLVWAFRLVKNVYLVVALGTYSSLLLNWAGLLDGPDRLALTLYAAGWPYLLGILAVILDETLDAFEWRLELDAERRAFVRCASAGRAADKPTAQRKALLSMRADGYPPTPMWRAAVLGGQPSSRVVNGPLIVGVSLALATLALLVAFSTLRTNHPDLVNGLLGAFTLVSLFVALVVLLASLRPGSPGGGEASDQERGLTPWRGIAAGMLRIVSISATFLQWVTFFLLAVNVVAIMLMSLRGMPHIESGAILALTGMLVVGLCYRAAANRDVTTIRLWLFGAAEFVRLTITAWWFAGVSVFPFYNDLSGLGGALMRNSRLVAPEMLRIAREEPGRLVMFAAASALLAASLTALATRGLSVDLDDLQPAAPNERL